VAARYEVSANYLARVCCPYKRNLVDLFVTRETLPRALRAATDLFRRFEARGHRVMLATCYRHRPPLRLAEAALANLDAISRVVSLPQWRVVADALSAYVAPGEGLSERDRCWFAACCAESRRHNGIQPRIKPLGGRAIGGEREIQVP
jgi:hypothetical protein